MKMVQGILMAAVIAALLPHEAQAGTVTLDLGNLTPGGSLPSNLYIDEYRFSPTCHIDIGTQYAPVGHTSVGWDRSGCDILYNANYLGTNPRDGSLYFDRGGGLFDLSVVEIFGDGYGSGGTFTSSKGGSQSFYTTNNGAVDWSFDGDNWKNIEWVSITNGSGGPSYWLETLQVNTVPEPATMPLVAASIIVGLAILRKKKTAIVY